ncbi:MAG: hypothetical protein QG599_2300 [Pseudomonadota bacterium]|nr:hypothetical protein [Pseudomonadota bacterium]
MNLDIPPEPRSDQTSDPSMLKLERHVRDLEAQLNHARQEQGRIKRQLQARLLAMTLEDVTMRREFNNALAELAATRLERERLETELASAKVEQADLKAYYERRLLEEVHRGLRLESELSGVYASLSWRLTTPLRWFNARLSRWQQR